MLTGGVVIAGFFTGGALAIRGGMKAARNSAIGCGILLAVIEGVGIGIQRMMAENTRLDVSLVVSSPPFQSAFLKYISLLTISTATSTTASALTTAIKGLRRHDGRVTNGFVRSYTPLSQIWRIRIRD